MPTFEQRDEAVDPRQQFMKPALLSAPRNKGVFQIIEPSEGPNEYLNTTHAPPRTKMALYAKSLSVTNPPFLGFRPVVPELLHWGWDVDGDEWLGRLRGGRCRGRRRRVEGGQWLLPSSSELGFQCQEPLFRRELRLRRLFRRRRRRGPFFPLAALTKRAPRLSCEALFLGTDLIAEPLQHRDFGSSGSAASDVRRCEGVPERSLQSPASAQALGA